MSMNVKKERVRLGEVEIFPVSGRSGIDLFYIRTSAVNEYGQVASMQGEVSVDNAMDLLTALKLFFGEIA